MVLITWLVGKCGNSAAYGFGIMLTRRHEIQSADFIKGSRVFSLKFPLSGLGGA